MLKKAIAVLFFPFALFYLQLFLAVLLRKKSKLFFALLSTASLTLWLLSSQPFAGILVGMNEGKYSPITQRLEPAPKNIVVLGAGNRGGRLPNIQLLPSTLSRLVEGIRLAGIYPTATLLLSGGRTSSPTSEAQSMQVVAILLGVPKSRIKLEENSVNTESQSREIKKLVREDGVLLVTSAWHMKRAMLLFTQAGTRPFPAPADFYTVEGEDNSWLDYLPSGHSLQQTEHAFYEIMALAWIKLSGFSLDN